MVSGQGDVLAGAGRAGWVSTMVPFGAAHRRAGSRLTAMVAVHYRTLTGGSEGRRQARQQLRQLALAEHSNAPLHPTAPAGLT